MVSKEEFLGKLPIFSELNEEELEDLAQITDEYEFETGAVIAYQRDIADRFYIVRSGRLFAQRVDERGIVRESRSYLPGDYFKDIWLFTPTTHEMTVNAAAPGRILVIEEQKFLPFLIENPGLVEVLELSEEARYEAEHTQAALPGREAQKLNLLTDEIVEYYERRTILLLIVRIIPPAIIGLLLTILAFRFLPVERLLFAIIALIPTFFALLVILFLYIDWANDYFLITNKHLVHNEYNLRRFRGNTRKIPIDKVQSVEILRPNLFQTLLNVGSAKITTAAREGTLIFDFIDDPKVVEETINKLRQRVQAMDAGRVQAVMRRSIEDHFEVPPAIEKVTDPDAQSSMASVQKPSLWTRIRRGISYRVVDGNTITYRKHLLTLLGQTWWQILAGQIFLLGVIFAPEVWMFVIILIIGVINFAWFLWRFEDWRNDTFQVNNRYVIDIDRQPFGFGESRKQAGLDNIQNVNADRPGFLNTIFNYGNVHIETAGASADITFEKVANPSRVQSDIFQRQEQFNQNQQIQEGQRRRKEYAVFIDVYQQTREQNRLPERRTPPLDNFEEIEDFEELDDFEI